MTIIEPKQKKNLSVIRYKYLIKQKLEKLKWNERNDIMRFVKRETNQNNHTIYRHINERFGGTSHNQITILKAFAEKFNCTIDELINTEI